MGEPVTVGDTTVNEGDIGVVGEDGVVVVPRGQVGKVLEMLPGVTEQEEGCMGDVRGGMELGGAIKKWRGGK